ncbi:hypothetical protein M885DRAFT_582256 [Pelagophyceae sp. CCMP2097]|nr:hypothetical protein M885DRAFT_582256 [Pelagophyceae sp. CCMP2097]
MASFDGAGVAVLYASATGTARELAYKAAEELRRCGVSILTDEPRAFDWHADQGGLLATADVAVIICSTTGDGEAPTNMRKCWQALLRKDAPRRDGLRYALYGLGDARYGDKYNAAARRLDARLAQLGAAPLAPRVLSDACAPNGGVLAPFGDWLTTVAAALGKAPQTAAHAATTPRFTFRCTERAEETHRAGELAAYVDRALSSAEGETAVELFDAKVVANERLTASEWWQDVRNLRLGGPFVYGVGDVAVLLAENDARHVDRFMAIAARRFRKEDDDAADLGSRCYAIAPAPSYRAPRVALPVVAVLRDVVARCVDLTAPATPDALRRLAPFTDDVEHREKLIQLSSPAGAALFEDYVRSERRSLLDVLEDFGDVAPPLDELFDEFEDLRPRLFSIASAPSETGLLDLCVARVQFETKYKRKITGLCSNHVCALRSGDNLRLGVTTAAISAALRRRPLVAGQELILVSAGTGVAPMRALTQAGPPTKTTFIFGCRDADTDVLYGHEWKARACDSSEEGSFELHLAVSRHADAAERAYVTRRLRDQGAAIVSSLVGGATMFIAGNAQMATDVRGELLKQLKQHAGLDAKQASQFLTKLERQARLAVEAYG